ncbi:MAG TPA: hypothetical protein VFV93_16685, partial [Thermomicrobiales bacterium]|nr:hypothetical protein [Thermomicrobiales bacterium]
ESPHRGYAFPSQQSEADFYGEDRSELITINKILVALDLIEIRKEMLTRVDERGRRWRVPHNLYRVKDRPDGVDLRAVDVLRVAQLAQRDDAVFRYVRRVFSERFRPIDGDNVWHAILTELRNDATWRELQDRTRAIEKRASARTRAGHQSRAGGARTTQATPRPAPETVEASETDDALLSHTQHDGSSASFPATSVDVSNRGSNKPTETDVEPTNTGSVVDVAASNTGSGRSGPSTAAAGNDGPAGVVGPSNTTYDQGLSTTTTTTTRLTDAGWDGLRSSAAQPSHVPTSQERDSNTPASTLPRNRGRLALLRDDPIDEGDIGDGSIDPDSGQLPVPAEMRGNGQARVATRMAGQAAACGQRETDEGVASGRDVAMVANGAAMVRPVADWNEGDDDGQRAASARTGGGTGERRLADPAAGGPLVDPGPLVISTFEAANDRRATPLERHLLAELECDADPPARAAGSTGADWVVAAMREAVASGSAFVAPKRIREIIARWASDARNAPSSPSPGLSPAVDGASTGAGEAVADVRLPGGASGNAVWATVVGDLARVLDRDAHDRLLAGSRIARYWRGTVEIRVTSLAAAGKLSNEYRGLVERHLNSRLRRPVAVRFEADADAEPDRTPAAPSTDDEDAAGESPQPLRVAVAEAEIGRQVWQSLLGDLARRIPQTDLDRLAGVIVLGQDAGGAIVLGAPSPLARRLLEGRYRAAVETSLAALLGQAAPLRILDAAGWCVDAAE